MIDYSELIDDLRTPGHTSFCECKCCQAASAIEHLQEQLRSRPPEPDPGPDWERPDPAMESWEERR